MGISIVCRPLPQDRRPPVTINRLVTEDASVLRLDRMGCSLEGQAAMWAAVVGARRLGDWPLYDLRSSGARGEVFILDHWYSGGEAKFRSGFLVLARLDLIEGSMTAGYQFTGAGVKLVTS